MKTYSEEIAILAEIAEKNRSSRGQLRTSKLSVTSTKSLLTAMGVVIGWLLKAVI